MGLEHHSPTSGGSAPQEVNSSAGVGPMQISPQEKNAPGASIPTGVGHPCTFPPRSKAGLEHHSPTLGGSAPKEVNAAAGAGAMQISPQEKKAPGASIPTGVGHLCRSPQEQSGAEASLPNIRGECPQGGHCRGGAHADFSPGKKRTWCVNPHWGGTPLQTLPPGAKWGWSITPQHQGEVLPRR